MRSERALTLAVAEMYVQGVATRNVKQIAKSCVVLRYRVAM
jgi:transposase-like protein